MLFCYRYRRVRRVDDDLSLIKNKIYIIYTYYRYYTSAAIDGLVNLRRRLNNYFTRLLFRVRDIVVLHIYIYIYSTFIYRYVLLIPFCRWFFSPILFFFRVVVSANGSSAQVVVVTAL